LIFYFIERALWLQMHMERFVNLIVKKLKDANLFASQGGPIILSQVTYSFEARTRTALCSLG
jgi:hypothetical protein